MITLYVVKWTRPGESIYIDYFMAHNENEARDKWNKLHTPMSNSAYIVDIQSTECDGRVKKNKDIYQMREFDEAKLVLAKHYIVKALKLIEEIENG